MTASDQFKKDVWENWASGPKAMVALADREAWKLGVHGEDYDDQVSTGVDLGILAGETASQGPDAFIAAFEKWANRNEEEE